VAQIDQGTEAGGQPNSNPFHDGMEDINSLRASQPAAHDLPCSLSPGPIDRSYLDNRPSLKQKNAVEQVSEGLPGKQEKLTFKGTSTQAVKTSTGSSGRSLAAKEKKRSAAQHRRSKSLDVVSNPSGYSYRMDMTSFGYTSESKEGRGGDVEPALSKPALHENLQHKPGPKQVHFDTSPQDAPSKIRASRATTLYPGEYFIGLDTDGKQKHSAPNPTPSVQSQQLSPFILNPFRAYQLDYDMFSSDSRASPKRSKAVNVAEGESSLSSAY
jgi:hypothetical protein